ncbi:MAG: DUF4974 domain-containing protein [Candidatus Pedobacter colombiensis]|uniref:DUF4974 domain-containing protein n=1 Tax=Candidatus Pedobacter colombiensis TaxID=3121371 RepID=A0AAJ6B8H9_9SPHI|nr:FecR family protein [Pedobacter sp.]WEK21375.1 MAG: DUF4974 domain-containing protein [Pedobacter sp.]
MESFHDKTYLLELAHKWKSGKLSPEELAVFDSWYNESVDDLLELPEGYAESPLVIRDRMLDVLLSRVHEIQQPKKTYKLWIFISAAAVAIILAIGIGVLFHNHQTVSQGTDNYANDIAPGKNGATLTLSNGKKIYITDAATGKLAEQSGVNIHKTADGQIIYEIKAGTNQTLEYNTLQTANGQQTEIVLPDHSRVFLNAASSLKYPSSFATLKERRVELVGEAYFEVSKDKLHPFIVNTRQQEVKVLGTHFNINSYLDANVKTTLLEGAVSVKVPSGEEGILLPGQQSNFDGKKIRINEVETSYEIAWKNGYFLFNNENLEDIMQTLSRWYNITVKYDDPELKSELFFGKISKYENVSKILKMLERTDLIKFKVEGNIVTISRKK